MRATALQATLLVTALALASFAVAGAQQRTGPATSTLVIPSMYGQDLFNFYCASCHGRDGRGGGPVAPALTVRPPDLTTLASRHGGQFPNEYVESFVNGNRVPAVTAHGTKEMPVWGPIFLALDPNTTANRVRVENIVRYIGSIQAAPKM
jgi:mono/diheme cytochrome c family protein